MLTLEREDRARARGAKVYATIDAYASIYIPNQGRPAPIEAALCNCLGFGSKNSAIVLGRAGAWGTKRWTTF